ncbi:hypothetical protein KIPB_008525 [Kipferlia bialata]|uniref:Uncharacterized protein n=1 Tax=Kipferlia bialata TaxID=797122 RepID=A0A391NNL2_9EUKA|nr:hypothetical protein KIPB_008525 [Kipferlia bialata]|eukprot:g8525.t1
MSGHIGRGWIHATRPSASCCPRHWTESHYGLTPVGVADPPCLDQSGLDTTVTVRGQDQTPRYTAMVFPNQNRIRHRGHESNQQRALHDCRACEFDRMSHEERHGIYTLATSHLKM